MNRHVRESVNRDKYFRESENSRKIFRESVFLTPPYPPFNKWEGLENFWKIINWGGGHNKLGWVEKLDKKVRI